MCARVPPMSSDDDKGISSDLQADFYERIYPQLTASGSQGRYHAFTHQLLEKPYGPDAVFPVVLEVGAGAGGHLPFVRHRFAEYVMTHIRDGAPPANDPRVRFEQACAEDLPVADDSCDRVIVTCLLHHLSDRRD